MAPPDIRVLIADDHPIFRRGLREVIEADPRLTVVAEAEDGESAIAALKTSDADVAVLDLDMPNKDGFDVARAVAEQRLRVALIILTMHRDERFLNLALDLGIRGYLLKDNAVTEIVGGIKAVAAGQDYVSAALTTWLINRGRRSVALAAQVPGVSRLTATERRIAALIADYKTSKEIADALCISHRTVEHHRANIAEKLDLKGSHALLKFCLEHRSDS